ncbi:hypothetical protein, partial [Pseudomonas amygdali]|uniref:hypothetical protein n=1 Tax=Pseudomonas amygdali TaxID=47877 RepID=UPI000A3E9F7E
MCVRFFSGTQPKCRKSQLRSHWAKEAIRINRFIEVAPPALDTLLAGAPARIRRSYPRADRVQQILYHLAMKPGRSDL